jgi:hypothetical protein
MDGQDDVLRYYALDELLQQAEALLEVALNSDDRCEVLAALGDARRISREIKWRLANGVKP